MNKKSDTIPLRIEKPRLYLQKLHTTIQLVSNTKLEVFVKIIVFQSTVIKKLQWAVL